MQHVPIYMSCSDRQRPTHSPFLVFLFGLPPFYFVPYLSIIHSSSVILRLAVVFVAWHHPILSPCRLKTLVHTVLQQKAEQLAGLWGHRLFICSSHITPCRLWTTLISPAWPLKVDQCGSCGTLLILKFNNDLFRLKVTVVILKQHKNSHFLLARSICITICGRELAD